MERGVAQPTNDESHIMASPRLAYYDESEKLDEELLLPKSTILRSRNRGVRLPITVAATMSFLLVAGLYIWYVFDSHLHASKKPPTVVVPHDPSTSLLNASKEQLSMRLQADSLHRRTANDDLA